MKNEKAFEKPYGMKNTIYTISGAICIQEEIINVRYWKIISIWMSKIGLRILYAIVGSLASEFRGWSWKTYVGIPMLDIGIPTSEFQCPT